MKNKLKLRGAVNTPAPILFLKGKIDGKLLKTGGLVDGTVSSGYITSQISKFESACEELYARADKRLTPVWDDVDRLLADYARLRPSDVGSHEAVPTSQGRAARQSEKNTKVHAARNAQRTEVLKRMFKDGNNVLSECFQCSKELEAAAKKLDSALAVYCSGLIGKKKFVTREILPVIDNIGRFNADKLCELHKDTWTALLAICKEEKAYEMV